MKIILITSFYPPNWGACAVRCYYFVKALRRREWYVDVLIPISPNRSENVTVGDFGERIMRLRFYTVPRSIFFEPYSTLTGALNLFRKISKEIYDVAIATVPPPDTALLAYYLKVLGIVRKLIFDIRDDISSTVKELFSYNSYFSPIQIFIANSSLPIYNCILRKADILTTATSGLNRYYRTLLRKDVKTVYNGADLELFSIKREINRDKGIFVADLNASYHRIDVIIKVISILSRKGINIPLNIVGDGRYRIKYENLCKKLSVDKLIKFLGYIDYKMLPKLMAEASYGIIGRPTAKNIQWISTVTNKFFEYIASGIPIFAYGPENSELEKLIYKYNLGMYVASNDPYIVADRLSHFLNLYISRSHILRIAKKFDRIIWAEKMVNLIDSLF